MTSPEPDFDVGDELPPWRRAAPSATQVAGYMGPLAWRERQFTDVRHARSLGFRGILVPGPMLSAFIDQYLRRELPGWMLRRLNVTFRVPTVAAQRLCLRGVVIEREESEGETRLVCELVVEHAGGERAVTGTATLRRRG